MLKIFTAFIGILFSSGAMAAICNVYLPPDCKEVTGSDMFFHNEVIDGNSQAYFILDIEVNCTIDLSTHGDVFYNHKKYKITDSIKESKRFEDYAVLFQKDDTAEFPYVVCNFD